LAASRTTRCYSRISFHRRGGSAIGRANSDQHTTHSNSSSNGDGVGTSGADLANYRCGHSGIGSCISRCRRGYGGSCRGTLGFFELKYDGFRALAYAHGGGAKLVSRRNLQYRRFDDLASQLSLEVNADDAVLDGEIVKLAGRPIFVDLMRRRGPFCFVAFDLLAVNGRDVRTLPLVERKKILREIVPKESRCILFAKHVPRRGRELFAAVCEQDLEGIVAKWKEGRPLQPGCTTAFVDQGEKPAVQPGAR
jgi:hypothetical protein